MGTLQNFIKITSNHSTHYMVSPGSASSTYGTNSRKDCDKIVALIDERTFRPTFHVIVEFTIST